ncbi:MAG: hypothetical protein CMN17_14225 [Roseovarius sp.]|nr:hypothetical protein [Roseovarius sp.]|tara:strand:+ start:631 stop:1131 length:501 start_codon:yes stop_codon:yes gene_type:complete
MLLAGALSLLGGVVALLNPLAATLTAALLTGYVFIGVGVLLLLSVFGDDRWNSRLLSLVLGLVVLALGISVVGNPLEGVLSLTVAVAVLMLVIGVLRIVLAFGMPTTGLRLFLILAGIVSLVLGVMILSNFPYSAAVVLGILLAIELLSNGASLIALALAARDRSS